MNRRDFICLSLAAGFAGWPGAAIAQRFQPTRFSVRVQGSGPDVVLIPGLTSGRDVWATTVAALPGYRYHLIQVAGFAGEPAGPNARGAVVSPLADELVRYIESRGLRRPAIVGHSMGGILALLVATRRPDLAGRVMVVDMLPQPAGLFGGSASGWGPLARGLGNMMNSPGGRQLFANMMGAFSPPGSVNRRSDPDVVGRAMSELTALDLTPQLPRLRAPLTVLYAATDPRARAALDRTFANAYAAARGARLVRIDDSGHMIMFDQPAAFRRALAAFLAR